MALLTILLILVPFTSTGAAAKPKAPAGSLTLPIAGVSLTTGATFSGTITVNRFVAQGAAVFAEGIVAGTVTSSSGVPLGTALQVPVMLPVTGNWGPVTRLEPGRIVPAFHGPGSSRPHHPGPDVRRAAPRSRRLNLDLLGVTITTTPVTLDISGDSAGPLGALVCAVLGLVGTVAGLVNLLNQLLGTLTGLLSGVV